MDQITTPIELYHVLRRCWSSETGSKWRADNPARGQCSVTSIAVQDVFGGDILKTRIGDKRWDLTVSQFDVPIAFDDLPASREEVLADTSIEQYRLLSEPLRSFMAPAEKTFC